MHVATTGAPVLGIAESYSGREQSHPCAGVVMRKDLLIDGVAFARVTLEELDATDAIIRLFTGASGARTSTSWMIPQRERHCLAYNIIDPAAGARTRPGLPVIVTTYEESEALEEDIRRHFPRGDTREARGIAEARRPGPRQAPHRV